MQIYKKLISRRKKQQKGITEVAGAIDKIIIHLNAAMIIAEKMKSEHDVQKFQRYKKIFHETWLGVAEHYNVINQIDVENLMHY